MARLTKAGKLNVLKRAILGDHSRSQLLLHNVLSVRLLLQALRPFFPYCKISLLRDQRVVLSRRAHCNVHRMLYVLVAVPLLFLRELLFEPFFLLEPSLAKQLPRAEHWIVFDLVQPVAGLGRVKRNL